MYNSSDTMRERGMHLIQIALFRTKIGMPAELNQFANFLFNLLKETKAIG